jgi:SOS-response transcriptional repressor LexA
MEGWDGRLLLTATDDGLAPDIRLGDRLVIDAAADARDGDCVVAFAGGALLIRRWRVRAGEHWLESGECAPLRLGPLVAILGVIIELRRTLRS